MKKYFIALLILLTLTACTHRFTPSTRNWSSATRETIKHYQAQTARHLAPAFRRAGVPYPPKAISLQVYKHERKMEVWTKHKGKWHYIKTYPLTASSGGPGPKLAEFDRQIPEGVYRIRFLDPFSHYHLSMALNYPNHFDRRHAKIDGREKLGHSIFIHGFNQSVGCIAIGDSAIEDIFTLVGLVGTPNAQVIISPNDIRRHPPLAAINHPKWINDLHITLNKALKPFNRTS